VEPVAVVVAATAHASAVAVVATLVVASVAALRLLPVRLDHCGLVSSHVVAHPTAVVALEAPLTPPSWHERLASVTAATNPATVLVLRFSLLDVDSTPIDLGDWIVLN